MYEVSAGPAQAFNWRQEGLKRQGQLLLRRISVVPKPNSARIAHTDSAGASKHKKRNAAMPYCAVHGKWPGFKFCASQVLSGFKVT